MPMGLAAVLTALSVPALKIEMEAPPERNSQVMAISLAPMVSDAVLEQLQQAEKSPIAIARNNALTRVALTFCW